MSVLVRQEVSALSPMPALESMALEMPAVEGHPNRVRFHGVLTVADAPSDKPPSGSRGHRVLLTAKAAEEAIPSLLGMAVDYTPKLDGHDARAKIGVITAAELEPVTQQSPANSPVRAGTGVVRRIYRGGRALVLHARVQQLKVSGYLFAKDFPEVVRQMQAKGRDELGMSYEIADVHVADIGRPGLGGDQVYLHRSRSPFEEQGGLSEYVDRNRQFSVAGSRFPVCCGSG